MNMTMASKKTMNRSLISEMDNQVQKMLKLMEEDGDSFAKKAEMYYQRRPELINIIENFHRMYKSLADRSDHGDGRRNGNCKIGLQSYGSGISDIESEQTSSTLPSPAPEKYEVAFDLSAAEYETISDDSSGRRSVDKERRIMEVEVKLRQEKEKVKDNVSEFHAKEEKIDEEPEECVINAGEVEALSVYKIQRLESQLKLTAEKLQQSEEEAARLRKEIENDEFAIRSLQAHLKSVHIWQICKSIEEGERRSEIDELKKDIGALQFQIGVLTTEKYDLLDKNAALSAEFISKDEEIDNLNNHLHEMRAEHVDLAAAAAADRNVAKDLRWRLMEAEKKQEISVSENNVEEAIKQLRFSLEHYRNAYHMLRDAFVAHDRQPLMAA